MFAFASKYDEAIKITLLGYNIDTSIFVFIAIFLLCQLAFFVFLRSVTLILSLPKILKQEWVARRSSKLQYSLVLSLANVIMKNSNESVRVSAKILDELDDEYKNFAYLILANSEEVFDIKLKHLRSLIDKKHFNKYACYELALVFMKNGYYTEAEKYAKKAFRDCEFDVQIIKTLIEIYVNLKEWPKMVMYISKLKKVNNKFLESIAQEIAEYYYLAAKSSLEAGEDAQALKFLESSVELDVSNIPALNLFVELNINISMIPSAMKVVQASFANNPCFEVAEMYIKLSHEQNSTSIYDNLSKIVDVRKYSALFLVIATYLNLQDKIDLIRKSYFIDYYSQDI